MTPSRRQLITGTATAALATVLGAFPRLAGAVTIPPGPFAPPAGPRSRVVCLNDLSGDVDGLFPPSMRCFRPA